MNKRAKETLPASWENLVCSYKKTLQFQKGYDLTVPNPFYKPVKKQVTLRIDADILAWLRQQGSEGYQSRLNAVLRQAMLQDLRRSVEERKAEASHEQTATRTELS